jgi:hypothetical protein
MTTTSEPDEIMDPPWEGASTEHLTREEAGAQMDGFLAAPELRAALDETKVEILPLQVAEQSDRHPLDDGDQKHRKEQRLKVAEEAARMAALEIGEGLDFPIEPDSALDTLEALLKDLAHTVKVLRKSLEAPVLPVIIDNDDEVGVTE